VTRERFVPTIIAGSPASIGVPRGGAAPESAARPDNHSSPAACLAVFLAVWTALAIAPRYRADWLLENLPIFIGVPLAVLGYRRFRFSNRAYVQATVFLILHTIGSHYTYSEVPLGDWMRDALHLSRNHYDRLVHFAFGALMLRPVRELGFSHGRTPGRLAELYFSAAGVACWSAIYEIVEWLVAASADPAAGTAYLGTQGDVWDAQKDMALALGGALLAIGLESGRGAGPPAR
jgi:putative membrane protein